MPTSRSLRSLTLSLLLLTGVASAQKWTGTITVRPSANLTPNSTLPNSIKLTGLRDIADNYEKSHPGIKIKFVDIPNDNFNTLVRAKAASGELYDIFSTNWYELLGNLPEGIALDLRPYFAKKSPYAPNAKTWGDALNKTINGAMSGPDGSIYTLNGDWVATSFYYNPTLFKKARIQREPRTWQDLISAAKKLKAAGIPVGTGVPIYSWYQRLFLTNFYAKDYGELQSPDHIPGMSALDQAVAIKKGILSTKDARFMAWWPILKEFTDYWNKDFFTTLPFNSADTSIQDFIGGRAAMIYNGSWTGPQLNQAGMKWEAFNFPLVNKNVTRYSTNLNTAGQVGGPQGNYQWQVASPKANKSLSEKGKLDAVIDFLMYLGSPRVAETVINESPSNVPTIPGAKAAPGTDLLLEQSETKLTPVWLDSVSSSLDQDMQRTFGLYLTGSIDLQTATNQVQANLDKALRDFERENGVIDLKKYQ
ncbi:extracellular solute-binding protein [Deinococcus roseus]|uniref:ABC transporter substrate-binding protein n=1 Tax=Deinococcus roseus TaxID=392414 RepID=A0ABQ2DFD5_9DEIO|nr:extracellular solute-binding protein [Deinococcus roseus]GGJ56057.1 hypothetical protein GCM10008938_47760 [Deinococcus roseus]